MYIVTKMNANTLFYRFIIGFLVSSLSLIEAYTETSFELLETIPIHLYSEVYKNSSSPSLSSPSGLSDRLLLIKGPFGIPVVKSSFYNPTSWGQLGRVGGTTSKVWAQPATAYALGASKPDNEAAGTVVGQVVSLYSVYDLNQSHSAPKYTYAFLWDSNHQLRNLSAAVTPVLKRYAPESYKKLQEVVLDHAFYISADEKTIYGVAKKLFSLNDPQPLTLPFFLNTEYQFFRIRLPDPASSLTSGKIFISLSLSENTLEL